MSPIFVESRYSSRWKGIVLEEYDIQTTYPSKYRGVGYKVLVLLDRNGKRVKDRNIIRRNKDWFKVIPALDITWVNKDWLI